MLIIWIVDVGAVCHRCGNSDFPPVNLVSIFCHLLIGNSLIHGTLILKNSGHITFSGQNSRTTVAPAADRGTVYTRNGYEVNNEKGMIILLAEKI